LCALWVLVHKGNVVMVESRIILELLMKGTVPFLKVCDNKRKGLQREDTSMQ